MRHCGINSTVQCDEETDLNKFWSNVGLAIYEINNNLDLTDFSLEGKPQ